MLAYSCYRCDDSRTDQGIVTNRGQSWCRGKTNFFEKRVGEYQKSGVMAGLDSSNRHEINFDADF